jgi:hypothetical protein
MKNENTTIKIKKLRISDRNSFRYKTFEVLYSNIDDLIIKCHNLSNSVTFSKVNFNLTDNEGLSVSDVKLLQKNNIYIL